MVYFHFSLAYQRFDSLIMTKLMFFLTIAFIALSAIIIQYLQMDDGFEQLRYAQQIIILLVIIWLIFFLERVFQLIFCPNRTWKSYLAAFFQTLVPPLRLASRSCDKQSLWLFGWHVITNDLYARFEKQFLYPIFIVSILMIPFWVTEIFFPAQINSYPWLYHLLNLGNALVWSLFVIEFIIMFSVAPKPVDYLKTHWLELFIIILPMFALARVILIARYAQLLSQIKLLKLFQIAKLQRMLNIYRARTVFNRIIRILMIVEIFKRFYQHRNPKKYLTLLQEQLAKKEREVAQLKVKIRETQLLMENKTNK
jgi:hypothetical protein